MSDFMPLFCSRLLVFHNIWTDPLACLKKANLKTEEEKQRAFLAKVYGCSKAVNF